MAAAANGDGGGGDVPYLSLNPKITDESLIFKTPSAEEQRKLKEQDPKLAYEWTIWEQHVLPKGAKWAEAMCASVNFGTVREFWACWNHLPQPSVLLNGHKFIRDKDGQKTTVDALMIFRKGVKPEWEDPANINGGHFQLLLKPQLGGGTIDELWNNIVLGMIGGGIEPANMITGVRLLDRLTNKQKPCVRIEVWFDDMDLDDTGRLYNLKGNLERCMGTSLDGKVRAAIWGYTEKISHQPDKIKKR